MAPSWEDSAPSPKPISSIGMATMRASAPGSIPPTRMRMPAIISSKPQPDDSAGVGPRPDLGDSGSGQNQGHGQREDPDPGFQCAQFQHHRQEQRDGEEHAGLHQELGEEYAEAAGEGAGSGTVRDRSADRLPGCGQVRCPPHEHVEDKQPADEQPDNGESAQDRRRAGLGLHPAPLARTQHAKDHQAEPGDGQRGTRPDRARSWPAGRRSTLRRTSRMTMTITTSPTKTYRQDANVVTAPPISGPGGDRDRARGGDQPVGRRPPLGREVGRDQRRRWRA